jgi:hypothetical protein
LRQNEVGTSSSNGDRNSGGESCLDTEFQSIGSANASWSGNRRLMGEQVNGKAAKLIGWATTALMAVAAVALFASGGVSL